jgi:hypothetical protein
MKIINLVNVFEYVFSFDFYSLLIRFGPCYDGSMKDADLYSDEETARRRDEVIKRMLNTSPQPRQQKPRTVKPKTRPAQKGRIHRAKARS